MASHLCCTLPHRTDSPTPIPNARILRRGASCPYLSRTASGLPQTTQPLAPSPEERQPQPQTPPRQHRHHAAALDTHELQRIFVAASLPEDHPHALRFPDGRGILPPLGYAWDATRVQDIPRSPSFVGNLKRRFSRRSFRRVVGSSKGLERVDGEGLSRFADVVGEQTGTSLLGAEEGGYDAEARALGSEEVLEGVGREERVGGVGAGEEDGEGVGRGEVRAGFLTGLEWLRPVLLQRQSFSRFSPEEANVAEIAGRVALRRQLAEDKATAESMLPSLPQAVSSPNLLSSAPSKRASSVQRSTSAFNWEDLTKSVKADAPVVERTRLDYLPRHAWPAHLRGSSIEMQSSLDGAVDPNLADAVAHRDDSTAGAKGSLDIAAPVPVAEQQDSADAAPTAETISINSAPQRKDSGLHLPDMHISQQLRSLSAMSETLSEDSIEAAHQPWNRAPAHGRNLSAVSALMPSIWERVRGEDHDGTSSVYSRPASEVGEAEESEATAEGAEPTDALDEAVCAPIENVQPEEANAYWPLREKGELEVCNEKIPSCGGPQGPTKSDPFPVIPDTDGTSEVSHLLSVEPAESLKGSKRSTSTSGKQSKFFERFTPPKKLVRKRRSIFKFLRPGSRKKNKLQARSISTPTLLGLVNDPASAYDGPADDASVLTVQYELAETPTKSAKAASQDGVEIAPAAVTNRLTVAGQVGEETASSRSPSGSINDTFRTKDSAASQGRRLTVQVPNATERRQSLVEYECSLSTMGDQRRRPSTPNMHNLQEMHKEEDRNLGFSRGLARRLSRTKPLADNAAPLMEQALQKHVEEKSLFRSASKAREQAEAADCPMPVFQTSSFTGDELSRRPSAVGDRFDTLDPMERGELQVPERRSYSVGQLGDPASPSSSRTLPAIPRMSIGKRSTLATSMPSRIGAPKRIGTSLSSWSRYPSHTREKRCGSAKDHDQVVARDFALDIHPHNVAGTDDEASDSEHHSGKPARLPKSRSMTFGGALRHFTDMLPRPTFLGHSVRRTSISTSGKLEYPELEMISPTLTQHGHHGPGTERLHHIEQKLEDIEENVKEYVKEDKAKLHNRFSHDNVSHHPSPFRQGSPFAEAESQPSTPKREKTFMLGPDDDDAPGPPNGPDLDDFLEDEPPHSFLRHRHHDNNSPNPAPETDKRGLSFDGTAETAPTTTPRRPSRANLLADLYKAECPHRSETPASTTTATTNDTHLMLPPATSLNPGKPRSPEQRPPAEFKGSIRRYPSVTVVDDRKGHWRSVSFLSVRSSRSDGGFVRSSTNDLLELVRKREAEEREKLLGSGGEGG
ncbi:hypothetical protein MBLNU230_g1632t1 [Neophaeotheca triangularis]